MSEQSEQKCIEEDFNYDSCNGMVNLKIEQLVKIWQPHKAIKKATQVLSNLSKMSIIFIPKNFTYFTVACSPMHSVNNQGH